jgi:6-pyruvoyltetrahydropterin/6-carboxytetrahydropterin synthase
VKITLTKRFEFKADHALTGMLAGHACATRHPHDYAVEFVMGADALDNGLVIDSDRLRIDVMPVIKRVANQYLNEVTDPSPWGRRLAAQPSVEHLTMFFFESCQFMNKSGRFRLVGVRVYESSKIWAEVWA